MRIRCPQCSTEFELNPPTGRSGKRRRVKFRCSSCGAPCTDSNEVREDDVDEASFASGPAWQPDPSDADGPSYVSENSYHSQDSYQSSDSYGSGGSYISQDSQNRPVPTLASGPMGESTLPFDPAGAYANDATAQQFEQDATGLEPFTAENNDEHAPLDNPEGTLLKQDGKVYHVRNLATIQRWIVERRVLREDLISTGGMRWEPVGNHPDTEIFFQMVERLDELELSARMPPPDDYDPRPPVPDETPLGNSLVDHDGEPADPEWEFDAEPAAGLLEEVEDDWADPDSDVDEGESDVYSGDPEYAYEDSEPSDYLGADDPIPSFDGALSATSDPDPPAQDQAVVFVSNKPTEPSPTLMPPEEVAASLPELPDLPKFGEEEVATEKVEEAFPEPGPTIEPPEPHEPTSPSDDLESFDDHFKKFAEPTEEVRGWDDDDSDDLAWNEDKAAKRTRVFGTLAVIFLACVLGAIYFLWSPTDPVPEDPVPAEVEEPTEEPVEEPTEEPVEEPTDEPAPEKQPEKTPEPAPEKQPEKTPEPVVETTPAPSGRSAAQWTDAGWERLESGNLQDARAAFVEALAADPRHADAHYGLGYTAQTQQDIPFAIRHYCLALDNANGRQEILRDVPALLSSIGGSCG